MKSSFALAFIVLLMSTACGKKIADQRNPGPKEAPKQATEGEGIVEEHAGGNQEKVAVEPPRPPRESLSAEMLAADRDKARAKISTRVLSEISSSTFEYFIQERPIKSLGSRCIAVFKFDATNLDFRHVNVCSAAAGSKEMLAHFEYGLLKDYTQETTQPSESGRFSLETYISTCMTAARDALLPGSIFVAAWKAFIKFPSSPFTNDGTMTLMQGGSLANFRSFMTPQASEYGVMRCDELASSDSRFKDHFAKACEVLKAPELSLTNAIGNTMCPISVSEGVVDLRRTLPEIVK